MKLISLNNKNNHVKQIIHCPTSTTTTQNLLSTLSTTNTIKNQVHLLQTVLTNLRKETLSRTLQNHCQNQQLLQTTIPTSQLSRQTSSNRHKTIVSPTPLHLIFREMPPSIISSFSDPSQIKDTKQRKRTANFSQQVKKE